MPAVGPIKRQKTLTEQSAEAIRARIVGGQFEFGEALSEIALAKELGVSKTPVREAFLQLKNEGLVEIQPQRGTFVFQMTTEQLRQLSELREILEVNSLRFGMRNDPVAFTRSLQRIIEGMTKAAAKRDPASYRSLDAEFHIAIIKAADNSFIESAYNIIALRVQAFRNRLSPEAQNWRALEEHGEIAAYVAKGDADAAAQALSDHIRKAFNQYVARISAEGGQTGEADYWKDD